MYDPFIVAGIVGNNLLGVLLLVTNDSFVER
jgi:hypothetical protein